VLGAPELQQALSLGGLNFSLATVAHIIRWATCQERAQRGGTGALRAAGRARRDGRHEDALCGAAAPPSRQQLLGWQALGSSKSEAVLLTAAASQLRTRSTCADAEQ
jgi:hypothetical protein